MGDPHLWDFWTSPPPASAHGGTLFGALIHKELSLRYGSRATYGAKKFGASSYRLVLCATGRDRRMSCNDDRGSGLDVSGMKRTEKKKSSQPTLSEKKTNLEHEHGNPKDWLHNIDGRCSGASYSQILFSQYFQAGQ